MRGSRGPKKYLIRYFTNTYYRKTTLRMLLYCRANDVYIARRVSEKTGSVEKEQVRKVNLSDKDPIVSYETIQLFVLSRVGSVT